jgi:hypothetical protein
MLRVNGGLVIPVEVLNKVTFKPGGLTEGLFVVRLVFGCDFCQILVFAEEL